MLDRNSEERDKAWIRFVDGRTGAVVRSGWSDLQKIAGPKVPEGYRVFCRAGTGYRIVSQHDEAYLDAVGRFYTGAHFGLYWGVTARPGLWLARNKNRKHPKWVLLDPETGAQSAAKGLDKAHVVCVLDDGRLLAGDPGLFLLDPETGARTDVAGPPVLGAYLLARTPGGALVLATVPAENRYGLARLDPATATVEDGGPVDPTVGVVGMLDEHVALCILGGRTLVKVDFATGARKEVFPR